MNNLSPPAKSYTRLAGAALGTMCGDALGMPVEGWSAQHIARDCGRLDTLKAGRLPAGSYTDDSQMMMAILDVLAEGEGLKPDRLAERFLARFEPWRGYGSRIYGVMERLADGTPWNKAGTDSYGNGGAMRVGVLGVYHADDERALLTAALDQCRVTHHHPQGLAGASAQALAVGLACRMAAAGEIPDSRDFALYLANRVRKLDDHTAGRLTSMPKLPRGDEAACRRALNTAYACDVTAPESVPAAIGAFLGADSAEQAIVLAVSLGGDTDTIGAMTGALAGAYWGLEALPGAWVEGLEGGNGGREGVLALCRRIAQDA